MLNRESCGNCRFYMSHVKVCRRGPPTPIMVGVKHGMGIGNEPVIQSYFPPMAPNGWCGDHRSSEESEPIGSGNVIDQ
jgi:hypothetical protein